MYKILVTGANGQLGSEIKFLSNEFQNQYYFADIEELDITDDMSVNNYLTVNNIEIVINCAAYTAVDKAESDQEKADLINHIAVGILAKAAKRNKVKFIHISTDYVFDGESYKPYSPFDKCRPMSVYGMTKRLGEEKILREKMNDALIVRTAWVFSSFGNNFVKTVLRLTSERDSINIVSDQIGSPTYARDLAYFILSNIDKINWKGTKVFQFTNEGVCSWFDFAKAICQIKKIDCKIIPIPTSMYPTPAPRPFYSVLSKEETKSHFQIEIPHWSNSLEDCLNLIES